MENPEQVESIEPIATETTDSFAVNYLESIRDSYQAGILDYRGIRNDDQKVIAEIVSDEADNFLLAQAAAVLALSGSGIEHPGHVEQVTDSILPENDKVSFADMRDAFKQAAVAVAIASSRAERDGKFDVNGRKIKSFTELSPEENLKIYEQMLNDFHDLNALRFGVRGSGVIKNVPYGLPDELTGKYSYMKVDPDKARDPDARRHRIHYRQPHASGRQAVHATAKLSPKSYKRIRQTFPEVDKDHFDRAVSSLRNPESNLENPED